MEVINPNGVKVYNLSTGKSFPKVPLPVPSFTPSSYPQRRSESWRRTKVCVLNGER